MMTLRRHFSTWWLLAVIPLVAIILMLAGRYKRQVTVAREFRDHVATLQRSGSPVDLASLVQRLRENTSDEDTVAWLEWMSVESEIRQASLSAGVLDGERGSLVIASPSPDTPWPAKPFLDTLVEQSEPAYERLQELSTKNNKVWLPTFFDPKHGGLAPQNMVWAIYSLTLQQMTHAVYEDDTEAAMTAFATHAAAINAFDWETAIRVELQFTTVLEQRDELMITAIEQGRFNAEQLERLKQLVGQRDDIAERWRNVIAAERAILLERLSEESELLSESSVPLTYLQVYAMNLDNVMHAADEGITELTQRATAAVRGLGTSAERELLNGVVRGWDDAFRGITPDVEGFARSLVRREASRKRVMEAIEKSMPKSSLPHTTQQHDEESTSNE